MRLIGAKEFLKTVKPGTLYKRYWFNIKNECLELIKDYKKNKDKVINEDADGFEIFGDNSGSLAFINSDDNSKYITIKNKKYYCYFYYDANVVGDASPTTTLYLVFDNINEWPEKIPIENSDDYLTKEEVIAIKNYFIKNEGPFRDELIDDDAWALNRLTMDEYYKDDVIVNYKGE